LKPDDKLQNCRKVVTQSHGSEARLKGMIARLPVFSYWEINPGYNQEAASAAASF